MPGDPSPQVDFYVLEGGRGADTVVCRLAEKAFQQGLTVFIRTGDAQRTRSLDDLLWTWRGASFLPHAPDAEADDDTPIRLGEDRPRRDTALLINVADAPPGELAGFQRVAEVVGPSAEEKAAGRERFRHYRERLGIEPGTHRLRG